MKIQNCIYKILVFIEHTTFYSRMLHSHWVPFTTGQKERLYPLRILWVVLSLYLQDTTNPNITILLRITIDRDYDSCELNILDNARIKTIIRTNKIE